MTAAGAAAALVEAYNRHDLGAYAALHAPTARITFANAPDELTVDGWTQVLARLFTALPDLTVAPVTMLADGPSAMVEVRQRGTHTGVLVLDDGARALLGCAADHIPPTGHHVDTTGVVVLGVTAGAIASERHHWPTAWLYQQLGLATVIVAPTIDRVDAGHRTTHTPNPSSRGG